MAQVVNMSVLDISEFRRNCAAGSKGETEARQGQERNGRGQTCASFISIG